MNLFAQVLTHLQAVLAIAGCAHRISPSLVLSFFKAPHSSALFSFVFFYHNSSCKQRIPTTTSSNLQMIYHFSRKCLTHQNLWIFRSHSEHPSFASEDHKWSKATSLLLRHPGHGHMRSSLQVLPGPLNMKRMKMEVSHVPRTITLTSAFDRF